MAEALIPQESTCVECERVCIGERITLECREHFVCMKCLPKRAERLGNDVASCVACRNSRTFSQDTSPVDARDNVWIFVDDSNIWIEGKKLRAKVQHLKTAEDPRARIDIGRLTDVVAKGRNVIKGTLYGSEPPKVDTVWNKIRKMGWVVPAPKKRSLITGKEKKVDAQLVADVTELACTTDEKERGTIIIISGDSDATPAIEKVLRYQPWCIEVCMWDSAISKDLKLYAKTNRATYPDLTRRFRVETLDSRLDHCMFTDYRFVPSRRNRELLVKWAVVFTLEPDAAASHVKHAFHYKGRNRHSAQHFNTILSNLTQWPFRHYLMMDKASCEANNLVVVFSPVQGKDFDLAGLLSDLKGAEEKMEALQARKIRTFKQVAEEMKYREALCLHRQVSPGLRLTDLYKEIESMAPDTRSVARVAEKKAVETNLEEWQTVKESKQKVKKPLFSENCRFKYNCRHGVSCNYSHTTDECAYFRKNGGKGKPTRKTALCTKEKCKKSTAECDFAHGEKDAWCLICCATGHLTDNCDHDDDCGDPL